MKGHDYVDGGNHDCCTVLPAFVEMKRAKVLMQLIFTGRIKHVGNRGKARSRKIKRSALWEIYLSYTLKGRAFAEKNFRGTEGCCC